MRKAKNLKHLGLSLLFTPLSLSQAAFAEDTAETPEVEEVNIVGLKLEGSLQETAASVEVFTLDRLDDERIVDLNDILLKTPNVNSSGSAGSFSIRGIGRSGVGNAGRGVTSNVYVDGAPLSGFALSRGPTSLWDVEQVEVLRGSQSSVQGRNALAGGVVVSTADPTFEPEGKARFTYGSFDSAQAAVALSGPLVNNQLAARIAFDYQDTDGFVDNINVGRTNDFRETSVVRAKFLLEPSALPWLSTKLTLDYNDADLGESRPSVSTDLGTVQLATSDFDFFDYDANGRFVTNSNTIERIVSDSAIEISDTWTSRVIITNEKTEVDRLFGTEEDLNTFTGLTLNQFDSDIFSTEIRFEFEYENLRGLIGGYYFDSDEEFDRDIQTNLLVQAQFLVGGAAPQLVPLVAVDPASAILSLQDGRTETTENYAIFGQVEWDFASSWTLNLGFRYDQEKFQETDITETSSVSPEQCFATVPNAIVGNPALSPIDPVTLPCQTLVDFSLGTGSEVLPEEAEFEAFLPKAALTYNLSADNSVFISYQRGYRAGGANVFTRPDSDGLGNTQAVNEYDPEFLDTIEFGTRNVFFDGSLVANATVFFSEYTDQQVVDLGADPINTADDRIINAGESTLYGLELLLDYSPNAAWNFYSSLGLLKTEFDDFQFASEGEFENLAGNEFPNAPEATFTLGGSYDHVSGFYANASFTYVGTQFSGIDNLDSDDFRRAFIDAGLDGDLGAQFTEELEDRTDLTARIGYNAENYSVYVFGTNLLNDEELTSVNFGSVNSESGRVALSIPGNVFATANTPRAYGVGVDLKF